MRERTLRFCAICMGNENRRTARFSRRHFEEKVHPEKEENSVRRPACQRWRQLANAPHSFQQCCDCPVSQGDSHAERHSTNCSPCPHQKRKRNCQQHTHGGHQWIGEFLLPLHS